MFDLQLAGKNAKVASNNIKLLDENTINKVLLRIAELLFECSDELKVANKIDLENAKKKGLSHAFIDRLTLSDKVIASMSEGVKEVARLTSPKDKLLYSFKNKEQGIDVKKIAVPFGVVGIIYESRPNVTVDAFALCFKTSNAVMLKGGSDSINSNLALVKIIKKALCEFKVDENTVTLVEDTSRETAVKFMKLNEYVDLLIPRGSASLINSALENATIPIIETGKGNCHIYVDDEADLEMASKVIYNAKTQRYGVCNACESLVIHSKVLKEVLPLIADKLKDKQVKILCDERSALVINDYPYLGTATEEDFYAEYDDALISVKTVDSLDEAIAHINTCCTHHSESIITRNEEKFNKFASLIDSSCVYHNCSTRFSDGFIFGLGAEIGISTQKLHARGPMGLEALVTTKYVVTGNGAVRK